MNPPVLPESAPFTPEQRGWLNGYLAATWTGFAGGGGAVAEAPAGQAVTILWGSQTGTAEGVGGSKIFGKNVTLKNQALR